MPNTYISSTIYTIRSKGSFSSSFNDYSNFFYERFDRTPSRLSSSCCDCCALSPYRATVNPNLLRGLRQFTLLQLQSARRLILGSGDRYSSRLPAHCLNLGSCVLNYSVKQRNACNRSRRRIKGRCSCAVSDEESEICHSVDSGDAQAVLSLLSGQTDEDFSGVGRKDVSSFERLDAKKKKIIGSRKRNLYSDKKLEVERKGNLNQYETLRMDLGKGEPNEERETFTEGEIRRKRGDVSSCSSYYSFSSSGDFGSDQEVQDKDGQFVEELSVGYEWDKTSHIHGQANKEFNKQTDDSEKLDENSNHEKSIHNADIDWNLRKKSEKKLTEITMEETQSSKEAQDMNSRVLGTRDWSYGKSSDSHKQFDSEEDISSLVMDSNKNTRKKSIQAENRRINGSAEKEKSGGDEVKIGLKSQKTLGGRQANLEILETLSHEASDELKKFVAFTSGKDVISSNSQKYTEKSNVLDTEMTSNIRMKNLRENKIKVSSVQGMEEHDNQKGKKVMAQVEERRKSQQFSELSQVHESNVENASTIESRTRVKNWEENPNLSSDANRTCPQAAKRTPQSTQPRIGSELVNTLSEDHGGDEKQVSSSQRTSNTVRFVQKCSLASVVETRESYCQNDKRITQFKTSSEVQTPTNLSISDKTDPGEASSFQESLTLVYAARKQHLILAGDERSSEIILLPSSSQLLARGPAHIEPTTGISGLDVCPETSESGSSALYDSSGRTPVLLSELNSRYESKQACCEPSNLMAPEDILGSADCLENSSKQFIDEFAEKVSHEVTTSETQDMEVTEIKMAFDDEKNCIYSLRQQSVQSGSQMKEHGSSNSSGFSGSKGPSHEMWDVTEPSVKQSPTVQEPDVSMGSRNPIVKRTGRSLWSILGDFVRLRWGSSADASTSAARSGESSSSGKSDSEIWFSGQEHNETSKSNVVKERTSVQSQPTTSDKRKLGKPYTSIEGDMPDTMKLKDKGKHIEVGMSSSPNTLGSGLASLGLSFASREENTTLTEDGKYSQVTSVGTGTMDLLIPLPARGPPFPEGTLKTGRSDVSGTEPVVLMEEPVAPTKIESSGNGRNDGELKQRMLQRKKQVTKDRFDEWEEAYKLELKQRRTDEVFMREALLEAKKAADNWEVPVGAVLVQHGKIIARGCNLVEELRDSTAHAEMICIREASNILRTWRLADSTLYVTLEPCPMCAGAILQARIDTLVWGAPNKLLGADGSWVRLFPDGGENGTEPEDKPSAPVHPFHPNVNIRRGVLASECADVMQQFFQLRRKKKGEPRVVTHPSKFLRKMHDIFHIIFCLEWFRSVMLVMKGKGSAGYLDGDLPMPSPTDDNYAPWEAENNIVMAWHGAKD